MSDLAYEPPSTSDLPADTDPGQAVAEWSEIDVSEPETADASRKRRRRPSGPGGDTRRAVERALAVIGLDDDVRRILADACGAASADVADVAVTSLESEKAAASALGLVVEVAGADPINAGVLATEAASDRQSFRAPWAVLRGMDASLPASPPPAHAKAGLAFAIAAKGLRPAKLERASAALDVVSGG